MKATQAKTFAPITLTIESQAELDYLYALSQSSVRDATTNALQLGFTLSHEAKLVQMPLYNTLKELKNA
jgi:hypothetical protein